MPKLLHISHLPDRKPHMHLSSAPSSMLQSYRSAPGGDESDRTALAVLPFVVIYFAQCNFPFALSRKYLRDNSILRPLLVPYKAFMISKVHQDKASAMHLQRAEAWAVDTLTDTHRAGPNAPMIAAKEAQATETAPIAAKRPCGATGMAANTAQLPTISRRLWPVFNAAFTATLL